jgi:hypothetical protein
MMSAQKSERARTAIEVTRKTSIILHPQHLSAASMEAQQSTGRNKWSRLCAHGHIRQDSVQQPEK